MLVLGWHGGVRSSEAEDFGLGYSSHDGAAVLLRDGEIVAAIEEERLNRVKHSNFFPARAIRFCLDRAGVTLAHVDCITFDAQESVLDDFITFCALIDPAAPLVTGRQWLARMFDEAFGVDVLSKLRFCRHHVAHIYSAIYPSGYARGLAVALDGEGDQRSGMVATFDGGAITPLKEYSPAQSLGAFYTSCIALLGYRRFDEYKVMGLAPYGDPERYAAMFGQFYALKPDGEFDVIPDPAKIALVARYGLLGHLRRKGEPFTQEHKDLAAGIQSTLERLAFHVFRHFREATGEPRLCFSGGVAHNCTLNGKLLYSGLFDDIFVQPAAHDAGNALGAALATSVEEGVRLAPRRMSHLFLGSDVGDDAAIGERLDAWRDLVRAERCADIAGRAADLLAGGAVIGWVQGQSEFGPRALGNRSILADPRPADFKRLINEMVKKREGYRPFAPSVLEERLHDYFEVPDGCTTFPYMIFVLRVREEMRARLGAVTHVDGTARVQTVDRRTNPAYHALIRAFEQRTGVGMLLNTSFNNDAEPIVDSVDDAIACFLTTGIQSLVVGDYLVTRRSADSLSACRRLVPGLRPSRKLVRRQPSGADHGAEYRCSIDSVASSFFGPPSIGISPELFGILLMDGSPASVDERCARQGLGDPETLAALARELFDVWSRRAITLLPPDRA